MLRWPLSYLLSWSMTKRYKRGGVNGQGSKGGKRIKMNHNDNSYVVSQSCMQMATHALKSNPVKNAQVVNLPILHNP